ncbi:MAG: hypothetical protein LDL33_09080 [Desulfomonile sp.]|nr:hypothetical protein [Desulfomonile sp.]
MGSKSRETREQQMARFRRLAESRTSLLKEQGLNERSIAKDSKLRSLSAKIKQVRDAIGRLNFLAAQTQELKDRKEQAKAAAAAARAGGAVEKKKKKAVEEKPQAPAAKRKGAKKGGEKAKQQKK